MKSVQGLNYSTHITEWWQQRRGAFGSSSVSALMNKVVRAIEASQIFLLPHGGRTLEEIGRLPAKYADLIRPPYPITAFEYFMPVEGRQCVGGRSSKRIALVLDSDAADSMGLFPISQDSVAILSVAYFDDAAVWVCIPVVAVIDRTKKDVVTEDGLKEARKHWADAGWNVDEMEATPVGSEVLDIAYGRVAGAPDCPTCDVYDEVVAAVQALCTLNCSNAKAVRVEASVPLNRKREAKGKLPLRDFHILEIVDSAGVHRIGGGTHDSPRQHMRRGHLRRLESKTVWVRSCVVGNSSRGVVEKNYRVSQGASSRP